nr:SpoIIE family protein phosphatase [Candidatus Krumholzibacteria bacterium]
MTRSSTPSSGESSLFVRSSRWFSLFVLAPLMLILSLPGAIHIAQKPDLGFDVHQLKVVSLDPRGPAARAGMRLEDQVIQANGIPVHSWASWYAATAGRFDLQPQTVTVRRQGQVHQLEITPVRPGQGSLIRDYSLWVVGLTFLLIGSWVFLRRRDAVARNFFGLCFVFAFFLIDIPDLPQVRYMVFKEHLRDLLQLLLPAYFLRFFLLFPSAGRTTEWSPRHFRLLLVPGVALFLISLTVAAFHPSPTGSTALRVLEAISLIYIVGYFLASLVIFARRAMRRDRPIQRTKMVVILLGLVAGLGPFLLATILGSIQPGSGTPHLQYLAFSLMLVPASFALAIMRYGALDKAFVFRIGLVYGLLTLFVLLVYFLVVVGLGYFLGRVFQVNSYPVLVLIMAASGLAILPMRRVIQEFIDQSFYPSRRAPRQAMSDLADHLTGLIDTGEVTATLVDRLDHLFRPTSLGLYLNGPAGEKVLVPRRFRGLPGEPPPPLPESSALARWLNRERRPVFTEELEDTLLVGESDPDSLRVLTRTRASLLVPMVSGNRLQGIMVFGPKNSGDLYSQEDLAHLRSLAMQAASVVESRRLYQESLERKRLETELGLARDLQRKLLPEGSLNDPCFVITGRNEPCRMVGGDYFDYFQRPDGTLGLAIADVAGKGIPAALQMTSLQFAFRQIAGEAQTAAAVMRKLNAAVTSLVSGGGFVCFFFGIWDPVTGVMSFCNGGMEPPVLFRPGLQFRQELRKGGPVLGVAPDYPYAEGTVLLQPGDRLFLYTDGLTDELNTAQEFFDADRLLSLVQDNLEASPEHLVGTVFSTVNDFGGDQKEDDKTAILLEIKKLKEKPALRSSSC